ncbi:hypothetical protein [Agromyces silvae]|nr:hypothetical protein [Agromyces protaetiae]
MTEAQIWVVLGVCSAISVAVFMIALIDFICVVRESLRADHGVTRGTPSD